MRSGTNSFYYYFFYLNRGILRGGFDTAIWWFSPILFPPHSNLSICCSTVIVLYDIIGNKIYQNEYEKNNLDLHRNLA